MHSSICIHVTLHSLTLYFLTTQHLLIVGHVPRKIPTVCLMAMSSEIFREEISPWARVNAAMNPFSLEGALLSHNYTPEPKYPAWLVPVGLSCESILARKLLQLNLLS